MEDKQVFLSTEVKSNSSTGVDTENQRNRNGSTALGQKLNKDRSRQMSSNVNLGTRACRTELLVIRRMSKVVFTSYKNYIGTKWQYKRELDNMIPSEIPGRNQNERIQNWLDLISDCNELVEQFLETENKRLETLIGATRALYCQIARLIKLHNKAAYVKCLGQQRYDRIMNLLNGAKDLLIEVLLNGPHQMCLDMTGDCVQILTKELQKKCPLIFSASWDSEAMPQC